MKIDWQGIPQKYQWAAMDYDGIVNVYMYEPACFSFGIWFPRYGDEQYSIDVVDERTTYDAISSLTKRPSND